MSRRMWSLRGKSIPPATARGLPTLAIAAVLLGAPGCGPPPERPNVAAETVEAILEADRAFAEAVAAGGVDAWVSYFAEDGVQLVPGAELRGHPAIREAMAGAFADSSFSLSWEPAWGKASAAGDLGFTVGRYMSRRVVAGEPVERTGTYITVWEKNAAGDWRVALDGGVPDGS